MNRSTSNLVAVLIVCFVVFVALTGLVGAIGNLGDNLFNNSDKTATTTTATTPATTTVKPVVTTNPNCIHSSHSREENPICNSCKTSVLHFYGEPYYDVRDDGTHLYRKVCVNCNYIYSKVEFCDYVAGECKYCGFSEDVECEHSYGEPMVSVYTPGSIHKLIYECIYCGYDVWSPEECTIVNGRCTTCGAYDCSHTDRSTTTPWDADGKCRSYIVCVDCGAWLEIVDNEHVFDSNGLCVNGCGTVDVSSCAHKHHTSMGVCDYCGFTSVQHTYRDGYCIYCYACLQHNIVNGECTVCGYIE